MLEETTMETTDRTSGITPDTRLKVDGEFYWTVRPCTREGEDPSVWVCRSQTGYLQKFSEDYIISWIKSQ